MLFSAFLLSSRKLSHFVYQYKHLEQKYSKLSLTGCKLRVTPARKPNLDTLMLFPDQLWKPLLLAVPIEASVTLFRPAALVRNNIYGLQAQLNQQLATPNTSVSVQPLSYPP